MRIGIDARFYGPRIGGGGLGRYVAELVTHLQHVDRTNSYVLFLRKENFHECVITNPNFEKRLVDVPWYSVEEQRVMPREAALARVQFMHYPHWNVPIFSRVPFIVTIHDLILVQDPLSARATTRNPFLHGIKYVGFRTVLENAIHRSRHIIAVSSYTKQSLLQHFRVSSQKITVIPHGVLAPKDDRSVSLQDLGVREPYVLYVGNSYPHKNLEMLVHAFALFQRSTPYAQLVLAGKRDMFSRRLEKEARELGIPQDAIRFLDLPTDEELAALYRHASLFVYPSRIEGFGFPPLEAMRYGTPVAAARTSSLPEVLGDNALFFEPDDIETLVGMMERAAKGTLVSEDSRRAAERHAAHFTWEKTAQMTLSTYLSFGARRL